jgi:hypothetical protein
MDRVQGVGGRVSFENKDGIVEKIDTSYVV